jgi:protein-glutamine gamma-glutamyltransferase
MPRRMHEGPEDYARRVAAQRPDLAATVTALCRHYSSLRYAPPSARVTLGQFQAAVRAFRPRGSRASS